MTTQDAPALFPPGEEEPTITIGAVCDMLKGEHPTISISKIRYLEDQKLISPKRTPGGYRLFTTRDVERLRTILRLQRDEFLPLRVIRQELAAGPSLSGLSNGTSKANTARRAKLIGPSSSRFSLEDVVEETGAQQSFVKELTDFGLIEPKTEAGRAVYDETDIEVIRAATELSRAGIGARNLRLLKTSADREASLVEALLAPRLGSRNPERRKEAVESLERISTVLGELKQALLVRDLRRLLDS